MDRYNSYKELFGSIDLRNYIDIPMIINVHDMSIFNYDISIYIMNHISLSLKFKLTFQLKLN